jgi:hypothetical protein
VPRDREIGREIERIEMKKAPLLRRAALKMVDNLNNKWKTT